MPSDQPETLRVDEGDGRLVVGCERICQNFCDFHACDQDLAKSLKISPDVLSDVLGTMAKVAKGGKGVGLGFTWLAGERTNRGKEGKWDLLGDGMHILNVGLGPGETVATEPGSLMFMGSAVTADVDCSNCLQRLCGGEPCAMLNYTNSGGDPTYVALTPAKPADIVALDMDRYGKISAKSGAFMTAVGDASPSCETDCNPATCCCAGFGCVRQTISGSGTAFIEATGTVERKELAAGELFVIDSNSLVAWHDATLGVRTAGSCAACCCNGEGCCNTTLRGPGTAWVQSMPWEQYKRQMGVVIQQDKGSSRRAGGPAAPEMHRE